jgi:Gpi18-like mannosyltransferase
VNPRAVAVLPIFLVWALRDYPPKEWLKPIGISVVVGLIIIAPFFADDPVGPAQELWRSTDVYPFNSFWAFNFWGLFGRFKADDLTFWGLTWQNWGIALFILTTASIIFAFRKEERPGVMALATALSMLAFYLFLTRMHERYISPMFLPLILALFLSHDRYLTRILVIGFVVLSVVNFFNVYEVYMYYGRYIDAPAFTEPTALFRLISDNTFFFSLVAVLTFPVLLATGYMLTRRTSTAE